MIKKLLFSLLAALTFVSCDLDLDINNPNDPYEDYSGRMIDRVRIDQIGYQSEYIYYKYDRRGRVSSIENTYLRTLDRFSYGENQYGDDVITIQNNVGDDRDMILDWKGYVNEEYAYDGDLLAQYIEYDYFSRLVDKLYVENYYADGSVFSSESYEFDYDVRDNLLAIDREYDEPNYYESSELEFSQFCELRNDYNIDILSILGLYIDCDFGSKIGRSGDRSKYLPMCAELTINRKGGSREKTTYYITYFETNGRISKIEFDSTKGDKVLYLSYQ